jgi:ATP phosphoribosyltransferase regulatory subunit
MEDGMTTSFALLPEGLRDTLPPYAGGESRLLRIMLDVFASRGFERVSTPLVEFDESLDAAVASGRPHDRFRFMDPISQRSLAVREDITGQVARIAATRLAHWARPLRLSYSGPVLRMRGTQLRADRQFLQVGAELVGDASAASIAEVILLSVDAVRGVGISDVCVDLVMPDFIDQLCDGMDAKTRLKLQDIVDAKDAGALAALNVSADFGKIIAATGPASEAIAALNRLTLPPAAKLRVEKMAEVIAILQTQSAHLSLSLDPGERRGFEFQTGVGFSLLSRTVRGEVGRGGTYDIRRGDGSEEAAVGFSLYLDGLIEAGLGIEVQQRVLVLDDAADLRAQGYATVRALSIDNLLEQAKAQRCIGAWINGTIVPVKDQ